jgi:biotin-(acetyl-CoA carboxylase) ligase
MTGTLVGIDDDGSLLLDTPEHVVRLHGGELSLRRA